VAYSGGAALPSIIDDVRAPHLFEFADAATIVGHNRVDAEFPAAVVPVSASGLGPVSYLREFDVLPANEVVLGNANLFSTTGRVTNPQASSIEGKIKLDQVRSADNQDGITIDKAEGVVYTYNASESLLESYYEATMVLRSAHEVPISGNFVRLLDAGQNLLIASDSTISIVDKDGLAPNRNLSPCETTDLSGVLTPGFVAQIDCAFNDAVYDPTRNVIYGSLPSFAGVNGNSVAIIDATSGIITDAVFAGSEPGSLSMSADGNTLYVALRETTRVAVIDLQATAAAAPIELALNKLNRKPVFAVDVAVSPQSTSTLLMAARQEIAIYENGARLQNVVSFYGPIRDALFDTDGSTAFAQKSGSAGDVLGILNVNAMGVTLVDEDTTTLRAGSLKLADGKLYDRFGVIADSETLAVLGNCDASSPFGTRLVEPSENSDDVFYVDRAADSVLTVCSESNFTNSKQVQVPLSGSLNSPPLALEEAGSNRLIMTSSDKLIIFQVDTLQ
jgi:DNA-binding beta-propeller fold protein YncE